MDFDYIGERFDQQLRYFEDNALRYQRRYRCIKSTTIFCSFLTSVTIGLSLAFRGWQEIFGIAALALSISVLAMYQWEEFHNYAAKWGNFRLLAEQLKHEKYLYLTSSGGYASVEPEQKQRLFVETVEEIVKATDLLYFSHVVKPGTRHSKASGDP